MTIDESVTVRQLRTLLENFNDDMRVYIETPQKGWVKMLFGARIKDGFVLLTTSKIVE